MQLLKRYLKPFRVSYINIPEEIFDAYSRFSNNGKHDPLKYRDKLDRFQGLCLG